MVVRKALSIDPPSISSSIRESCTSHTLPKSPAHPIFSRSFINSSKSPSCGGMSGQMRFSVIFIPVPLRAMAVDSGRASLLLREWRSSFSGKLLSSRSGRFSFRLRSVRLTSRSPRASLPGCAPTPLRKFRRKWRLSLSGCSPLPNSNLALLFLPGRSISLTPGCSKSSHTGRSLLFLFGCEMGTLALSGGAKMGAHGGLEEPGRNEH